MARPFRIEFPGALYRVISKEWVVTRYLAKKWEDVYGFFEVLDLALCHLVQSPGIESVGKCIPSWWGTHHWVIGLHCAASEKC